MMSPGPQLGLPREQERSWGQGQELAERGEQLWLVSQAVVQGLSGKREGRGLQGPGLDLVAKQGLLLVSWGETRDLGQLPERQDSETERQQPGSWGQGLPEQLQ